MRKERAEKDKADREQAHREAQAYQQQSQQHQYGLYPPQQQQYPPNVRGFYIFVREYLRDRKIAKIRRLTNLTATQNGTAVPLPNTEQSSVRIVPKEDATVVSVAAVELPLLEHLLLWMEIF